MNPRNLDPQLGYRSGPSLIFPVSTISNGQKSPRRMEEHIQYKHAPTGIATNQATEGVVEGRRSNLPMESKCGLGLASLL